MSQKLYVRCTKEDIVQEGNIAQIFTHIEVALRQARRQKIVNHIRNIKEEPRHKTWKNTKSPARSDISNHLNKDQDKKDKMITHEIEVPKGKAGLIVGKGGKTVQRNSLAEIESPEYGKNTFKLHGTVRQIRQAIDEMHEVLKNPGIDDQGTKDQECEICTVPVDKVGLVIGKQGHKFRIYKTQQIQS